MKTRLFLFTVLVMNCLTGFSQKYLWSSQFGIADVETSAKSMAIDADNNVYLTGCFTGAEMTIGDKEITGTSTVMDAYIAKFTPNKQCVFASSIKSTSGSVVIQSVATDASGNSYVVGNFESDAQISETFKIESDYKDFLIAKYDATGNPVWLKGTDSGIEPVIKSIAVNQNDGSFVITGAFTGNLNMDINGGNSEISSGDSELAFFIAKYDSNANLIWTKTMSGSGTGTGNLISVDEEGGIYAAGTFSGTIQFGTQSMTAASVENTDNFLVKYSADGNMIWARSLTGSKLDDINAMDVAGNQVVIGGVIRSEDLVVDNAPEVTMKTLDTSGSWNSMLIVSFDTNGNYQWNYIAGSITQPTDVKTIAIDKDGSIWNAGTSFGTYYFNPDTEDEARQFPSKAKGGQDIQKYCEQAAYQVMEKKGAKRVSIIVMNPQNGEIMAMVSAPEFNLNDPFTLPEDPGDVSAKEKQELLNQMWRNPCINDTYEPGSTFKIVTAAAGLEAGVVNLEDHFSCPGFRIVEDRKIRCHKVGGHGSETFLQGMMNSCNPVLIDVGQRLGVDNYYKYFEQFGLKGKTGIDLPGEAATIMHKKENMGLVELATVSFGQSFQITPMQLITTASAIVNGGNRVTPHFGVGAVSADGEVIHNFTYPVKEGIVSAETSETMRYILEKVVSEGSGKKAYLEGYRIGGKTATSEKLPRSLKKYISSFIGFAPADNPSVIALITIDEPQGIYYGGTIAAPVIADIFKNILPYLGIEATEEKTVSSFRFYS